MEISPSILHSLFTDSYNKILAHSKGISHAESIQTILPGANPMHWILGHIVVARCNFSMLLEVPSIWEWATCALFVPGSEPSDDTARQISFDALLADLERTQKGLLAALERVTSADLAVLKDEQTVGQQLAEYAAHETYHAGQLAILRLGLDR
jgi:hypothetical protein